MNVMLKRLLFAVAAVVLLAGTAWVQDKKPDNPFVYDWEHRHAPIPRKHVFQTQYLGGTQIVFDHELHTKDLGLECIECHHVEGCQHCHGKQVRTVDVQESKVALHTNCFVCHADKACIDCHRQ
ncbi:MAG: cytochrome c3 family protein [bacterium]|jgi:hypothetical protein